MDDRSAVAACKQVLQKASDHMAELGIEGFSLSIRTSGIEISLSTYGHRVSARHHEKIIVIKSACERVFGVPGGRINQQTRKQEFVFARCAAIAIVKERFPYMPDELVAVYFDRHRTTIINSGHTHEDLMFTDKKYQLQFQEVQKIIQQEDEYTQQNSRVGAVA